MANPLLETTSLTDLIDMSAKIERMTGQLYGSFKASSLSIFNKCLGT